MSLYCDPEEVLHQLNILGYENITEEQLKEFIRDLKKLVKYDQRKILKQENARYEIRGDVSSSFSDTSSSSSSSFQSCFSPDFTHVGAIKLPSSKAKQYRNSIEDSYSSSDVSTSSSSSCIDLPDCGELIQKHGVKSGDFNSRKENANNKKSKSFIKSWRLKQSFSGPKNDPVALYHWYKEQWDKQKVPGEEARKQLRWLVRERMLGNDPNPRPMSQASGRSSNTRREWIS